MFNLTKQERQVILFLLSIALLGAGVNFYLKQYSPVKSVVCLTQDIGKADINQADKETLVNISGIGNKLAERIIAYRREQGGFKDLEELKKIKGMNNYRYEKLKDFLCVK